MKEIDRKSPDALTALKTGDVLLVKGAHLQVLRPELGYIRHSAWVKFDGEHGAGDPDGTLVSMGSVHEVFANSKPGDTFRYQTNGLTGTYLGEVQYRETHLSAVPVAHAAAPRKDQIVNLTLVLFRAGDRQAMDTMRRYEYMHNAEDVQVTAALTSPIPVKGVTKWSALAYVVGVHGPLTRAQALKHAQQVLGLPYVPGSNSSYFAENDNVVSRGLLAVVGKKGNALVYGLGPKGRDAAAAAASVLAKQQ